MFTQYLQTFAAIKCPRLRKPHYGEVFPPSCSTKKLYYGAQCAFACRKGFRLRGPSFRQCHGRGSWTGGQVIQRILAPNWLHTRIPTSDWLQTRILTSDWL